MPLTFKVIVIDDYEPWRRFVIETILRNSQLTVVCEAEDGLEGVDRVREHKPDLILLDIGLPKLNGLEAAQRIIELGLESKILFVTANHAPDVIQHALSIGAHGVVIKSQAQTDLLPAINTVLEGGTFVPRQNLRSAS